MRRQFCLVAVGVALAAVVINAAGADKVPPASAGGPALGVYRGANATAKVDAFAAWLGRPAIWGEDFIGSESWSNVGWPIWWLKTWSAWVHEKPGRRFVFAVPLLPGPVDGSGPTAGNVGRGEAVSLERGAHGDYNINFKQLAENLVAHQLADTVLRPGWEFNGDWYTWRAKGKEQALAEYWRQIVKTMRAVPGTEKLLFCWNPTLGPQQFPAEQAWPGDAFVDLVGVDVYDESWQPNTYPWPEGASADVIEARQKKVWESELYGGNHGLAFWSKFAREHGKRMAICEWGVKLRPGGHGGRDNPFFVEQMHRFINDPANQVLFHCYFEYNCEPPDGHHQLSPGETGTYKTDFPRAAAKFKELFRK